MSFFVCVTAVMATERDGSYGALQREPLVALMVVPSTQLIDYHPQRTASLLGTLQEFPTTTLSALCDEWRSLIHNAASPHLFDQPEWALLVSRASKPRPPFRAIVSRVGDELIGVLPVSVRRTFLGVIPALTLRGATSYLVSRTELICHPSRQALAVRTSWEALHRDTRWRVVELPNVPADGAADSLVEHARHDGYRVETLAASFNPYIDLRGGANANVPTSSRVYRARLETKLRKISQFGGVHLRSYTTIEEPLAHFHRLESASSKHATVSRRRNSTEELSLYREAGSWAERCGALKILSLELNGAPLAMLYGILWRQTYYALRIAYDTRFSMYSPGQLLVMLALQELWRQGTAECEFVGPALPWKMVWTSTTRQHHSHFIFRPSKRGRTPLASALLVRARAQGLWRRLSR